jgi:hypothetical protein
VEQQGGTEAFRRDEALMAVATLSINDPQFLNDLRTNLEATLWRYGFALSPQEMQETRNYFETNTGLSDQAIIDNLGEQVESGEEFYRWFS